MRIKLINLQANLTSVQPLILKINLRILFHETSWKISRTETKGNEILKNDAVLQAFPYSWLNENDAIVIEWFNNKKIKNVFKVHFKLSKKK